MTSGLLVLPPERILHRDAQLLLVDKPSGVAVHHGWSREGRSLVGLVRDLVDHRPVHALHRLDRATSGVVALALTPDAARILVADLQAGRWSKRYLALVRGVAPEEAVVDHPIPRVEGGERVPAFSRMRRLAFAETRPRHTSLVEVRPETGRLHQVRRHLKHLNHPVIHDAKHGDNKLNRALAAEYGLTRLALHAVSLRLLHPVTREELEVHAPLPEDLAGPLRRMGYRLEDLVGPAQPLD